MATPKNGVMSDAQGFKMFFFQNKGEMGQIYGM